MGVPTHSYRIRLTPLSHSRSATCFLPQGGVGHGPLHRQPCPVNPLRDIVFDRATLLPLKEDRNVLHSSVPLVHVRVIFIAIFEKNITFAIAIGGG